MKKAGIAISLLLIAVLLFVICAIAIAGLIGYTRVETGQDVTMHSQYDEMRDAEITLTAPADLIKGQEFNFSGRLTDSQTGEGIAEKQIFVRFEGMLDMSPTATTDQNGYFGGQRQAPVYSKDVEKLKAVFAGD